MNFAKWDLVYPKRYPDSISCYKCGSYLTVDSQQKCPNPRCNSIVNVSNIIDKVRPCILWIDQTRWFRNMTFGIPTSASRLSNVEVFDVLVKMEQVSFLTPRIELKKPFRAVVHQCTRLDGGAFNNPDLIGKITDKIVMDKIEEKLMKWLFYTWI